MSFIISELTSEGIRDLCIVNRKLVWKSHPESMGSNPLVFNSQESGDSFYEAIKHLKFEDGVIE